VRAWVGPSTGKNTRKEREDSGEDNVMAVVEFLREDVVV